MCQGEGLDKYEVSIVSASSLGSIYMKSQMFQGEIIGWVRNMSSLEKKNVNNQSWSVAN